MTYFTSEELAEELRSCPFCGHEANMLLYSGSPMIACSNCNSQMGGEEFDGNGKELIDDWNRRSTK